jgi:DNA methyltransferase 1-associated protein 1
MPTPKVSAAIRITELLIEMGIHPQRLVMPTRANLDALDGVLQAAGGLVDMKRQVDRVDQELRTLRAQREGFVPPVDHITVSSD